MRDHAVGEEPLSGPLARLRFANAACAPAHAGDDCGADCSLKVEHGAVVRGAELAAELADRAARVTAQRMALPFATRGEVETVDNGRCGVANRHCGIANLPDP